MADVATTSERLQKVRDAIDALVAGKIASYTVGSRSVTKVDLPSLEQLERRLAAQLVRERGHDTSFADFDR